MEEISTYLAMGGYWPFIWPAYGTAAIILVAVLVATLRSVRANERALAELEKERPRRRRRTATTESPNDA